MNRRHFLASAAAFSAATLLPGSLMAGIRDTDLGINLGVITYSFRSMPGTADDLLGYLVQLGLNTVELMGEPIEAYAGAPQRPDIPWRNRTEAQKQEYKAWQEEMSTWRKSASMRKFKELRKKYNGEGVSIDIAKFRMDRMDDEEVAYCFKVAKALKASGITLERSDSAVEKLSPFADKYKRKIGYHNHAKVNFNSWDEAIKLSPHNALNLDVGHYVAGTNESPIPLLKKYHDRILSIHLKDRKKDNGPNMPWGEGDTPLKEILQLMKKEQYTFMATIELEYKIPEGSDALKEVAKCIAFCKAAL